MNEEEQNTGLDSTNMLYHDKQLKKERDRVHTPCAPLSGIDYITLGDKESHVGGLLAKVVPLSTSWLQTLCANPGCMEYGVRPAALYCAYCGDGVPENWYPTVLSSIKSTISDAIEAVADEQPRSIHALIRLSSNKIEAQRKVKSEAQRKAENESRKNQFETEDKRK